MNECCAEYHCASHDGYCYEYHCVSHDEYCYEYHCVSHDEYCHAYCYVNCGGVSQDFRKDFGCVGQLAVDCENHGEFDLWCSYLIDCEYHELVNYEC